MQRHRGVDIMIRKMNKNIIFYLIFGFFVFCTFLYLRFPGGSVGDYISRLVAARYPDIQFSFESVSLAFPPGVKLKNVALGFKDNTEARIGMERLKVRPRLLGFILGRSSYVLNVLACDGTIKAVVDFPGYSTQNAPADARIRFDEIKLEKCAYIRDRLGRSISGKLGGLYTFKGDSRLDFTVQNGSYQLLDNLFGFNRLDFSNVEGQLTVRGGVLKVMKLRLKGEKISCSLKGDIILNRNLKDSEINLNGTMEIAALNNKKVSMLMTGTLGNVKTRYL